jgi:hypothetical protein
MGQFDDGVACPKCGTWGARKSLWKVKCTNPSCEKYDSEYAEAFRQSRIVGKSASEVFPHLKGKADPNDYSLRIRYQNFQGNEITGKRVSFRLSKIQNRNEVEPLLSENPQPLRDERRILRYHLRRGSTSPAFEELRQKYPNFRD